MNNDGGETPQNGLNGTRQRTSTPEQSTNQARSKINQTLELAHALGTEGVMIGSAALRHLGVERACNDLEIVWTGREDALREAAQRAFKHNAWTTQENHWKGKVLRASTHNDRCAVEILAPSAWWFTVTPTPGGSGMMRVASRESLAAMTLALMQQRERTNDVEDLSALNDYGTNAEDAGRELIENLGRVSAHKALERVERMPRGKHWVRGLKIALGQPRREDEGEMNWRIHPIQCAHRHTLRHVLREETRYANGTFVSATVADYAELNGVEAAIRRSAPNRSVERSAFYHRWDTAFYHG